MTPTSVITDRDTLRKASARRTAHQLQDARLPAHAAEGPGAVGAQRAGDAALCGRGRAAHFRRRARYRSRTAACAACARASETPENHLICVGTSATLGAQADTAPLREYARQVFGSPFEDGSVITEHRLSAAEFLGDATIEHVLQPRADFADVLDPDRYASQEAAVAAWFPVFFPELPRPAQVADPAWRVELGGLLKKHLLFVNLLKLLKGGIVDLAELMQQLQGPLPGVRSTAYPRGARRAPRARGVGALPRDPSSPILPFVIVRAQVWMRELRRMVARVAAQPANVDLRSAADLRAEPGGFYLPLVQCSECHTTGMAGAAAAGQPEALEPPRRDLQHLVLRAARGRAPLCRQRVESTAGRWRATAPVRRVRQSADERRAVSRVRASGAGAMYSGRRRHAPALEATWPSRGTTTLAQLAAARHRQILLGARNATLGSQVVERSWASPFNDDKKLIAFSDSVQDAAHRAGFFGARTYANTVRTALAKAIDHAGTARRAMERVPGSSAQCFGGKTARRSIWPSSASWPSSSART